MKSADYQLLGNTCRRFRRVPSASLFFDIDLEIQNGYNVSQNCNDSNLNGLDVGLGVHNIYYVNYGIADTSDGEIPN